MPPKNRFLCSLDKNRANRSFRETSTDRLSWFQKFEFMVPEIEYRRCSRGPIVSHFPSQHVEVFEKKGQEKQLQHVEVLAVSTDIAPPRAQHIEVLPERRTDSKDTNYTSTLSTETRWCCPPPRSRSRSPSQMGLLVSTRIGGHCLPRLRSREEFL